MLEEGVKRLASADNFAVLTTLMGNGVPQTNVMWVHCDDSHILINTEVGRQKFRNVQKDPRVSIVVWDKQNPYHYAEVRGRVVDTVTGPEARTNIDDLSRKYTGGPYENPITTERVVLKIAPDRQRIQ